MKRFLGVLLLICALCSMTSYASVPSVPIETEDEVKAEITLPVDDIKVSDIVYLTLDVDCEKPVYAYEVNIEFDSGMLSYKEADMGEETDIKIENEEEGKLMFALSSVGENILADDGNDLCTFSFKAKKSGKTTFKLSSVTIVFDDMTYYRGEDIDEKVSLKVKSLSSAGSSGGSSGGSSIGVSKPVTSTGSNIPPEPQITVPDESTKEEKADTFLDVNSDFWGYKYIEELSSKGILNGYADGSFMPENPITRAEFSKLVYSAFELAGDETENISFSDVDENDWYCEYVTALSSIGIIKGENGSFYPDREITREEAATVIKRCADYKEAEIKPVRDNITFNDEEEISDFAVSHIDGLYMAGIISGDEAGNFCPKNNLSRAEAAAMVYNLLSLIGGEAL